MFVLHFPVCTLSASAVVLKCCQSCVTGSKPFYTILQTIYFNSKLRWHNGTVGKAAASQQEGCQTFQVQVNFTVIHITW